MFIAVVVWLVLCFIIGSGASKRGKSGAGYFFLSLFLSPLIGFIALWAATPNRGSGQGGD
jgi:hypothetical protein